MFFVSLLYEPGAAYAGLPAVSAFGLGGDLNRCGISGPASLAVEWSGHFDRRDGHGT